MIIASAAQVSAVPSTRWWPGSQLVHCESPAFVQVMLEVQKSTGLQPVAQLAPWKPASQVHEQAGRVPVASP